MQSVIMRCKMAGSVSTLYHPLYLSTLLFILCIAIGNTSDVPSTSTVTLRNITILSPTLPEEHIAVQKWKAADKVARKFSSMLVKNVLPLAVRASEDLNLSPQCIKGLMKFLTGVKQLKLWAIRMLDASGKIPNGIYNGNINSLGDYDECIETMVPDHFQGQYCTIEVTPPVPERRPFSSSDSVIPEFVNATDPESATNQFMRLANYYYHLNFRSCVCVPSTCNAHEVEKIASKVMELIGIEFNVKVPNCEMKTEVIVFSRSEAVVMVVLGIILFLGIISTVTDVFLKLTSENESYQANLGIPTKCLLCFSYYTNTLRLLKRDESPDSIRIFHGMKVITILWVILNHTYYYLNFQACSSLLNARAIGREKAFQFIANGFLNVETFFFISAVLVAYGVMKMKEEKLNVGLYIFRRFWRLTPPLMFIIACVHLLSHIGSGPVWKETVVEGLTEKCRATWWTNLLYINNFISNAEMCLQWTWYIPVDTHLYFLSLLVLIPLKKNPKLAFMVNGAIFVISTIVSAVSNVYYKLHPTAIYVYNHPEDISYFIERGYFRTYLHCSTYCVGLSVGYILATRKKMHISLHANMFGWISAFVLALSVLYGVYDWNQGNVPGIVMSTLYTCTNKLVWSLALAWVTLACVTGHGGIANRILSWEAFVPFGRLTYMAYLVHPIIQFVYIGSTRTLIRTAHRTLLYMYLGNVVLAFICAYGLSLMFESPFMALEKVIFSSRTTPRENSQKINCKDGSRKGDEKLHAANDGCEKNVCAITIKPLESDNL